MHFSSLLQILRGSFDLTTLHSLLQRPVVHHYIVCFYSDDKPTKRIALEVQHFDVLSVFLHWFLQRSHSTRIGRIRLQEEEEDIIFAS